MKQLVDAAREPGLLAYRSGNPVGWIAVAPRHDYLRIAVYGSPDAWVIGCLYVVEDARGSGIAKQLISRAVAYASERGATVIEAIPRGWRMNGIEGPGPLAQSLLAAGFSAVDPIVDGVYFRMVLGHLSPWLSLSAC
jgi:GNAT superfamily N-acetyltransferase